MQMGRLIWALLAVVALGGAAQGRVKVIEDQRGSLKTLTSIGDALDSPDHHPVHVLYVHGIDQVGGGDSSLLRQSICTRLKLCDVADWTNAGTEFADKGEFAPGLPPPALEYLGSPIWNTPEEWSAAAPFVVHWMVHLRGHRTPLVVDEINWWPIALSLKCRRVMIPEAYLAGPDQRLLSVCSDKSAQDPEGFGRFYPWIAPEQVEKLENIRPHSVLLNRALKDTLVDWGLADVLLATGPLGGIMRDGVRQLIAKSAAFDPTQAEAPGGDGRGKYNWNAQLSHTILDQEFVGVTHSLGSYLLFNTLSLENSGPTPAQQSAADAARIAREENAVRYIFERTSMIYFLANQLEMLEITNLENAPPASTTANQSRGLAPPPVPINPAANFISLVNQWKEMQTNFQAGLHPGNTAAQQKVQVVAFSDPNDVMTFRVPRIGDVDVINLYVQNATRWFGLLESPSGAHSYYAKNKAVLLVMFGDTAHQGAPN
ncbi:exported hypothetical protein [Candidatus Sulfotelmatomonas gaucii]|uniref:Uncharacterized protein n=1 Tax=Candidatus Sulfuritelmatomonas gaucii TaxID=2043161 RepID=A0A2N9L9Z1_9BACT|nr:exported hypothetical protein [Candidatus Sulfotelmatomonas gaucii]